MIRSILRKSAAICLAVGIPYILVAQDSLNVTFRHYPAANAVRSFLPGSFNNWGNNSAGRIQTTDGSLMQTDAVNGFAWKTVRLRIGGGGSTLNGQMGYAYKTHDHVNATGTTFAWYTDPLNPLSVGPNSDSFIQVRHPLVFQMQPARNAIIQNVQPAVWATVAARETDPISVSQSKIFINDVEVGDFSGRYDTQRQLLHVPSVGDLGITLASGTHELKIVAVTQSGATRADSTTFSFITSATVVNEARPQGLQDGITYDSNDATKVTLSLFAPGKQYVYVIGDFNDWGVNTNFLMKRDALKADSVWHWITLTGLTPGQEYGFQYLVDGAIRVADPYATKILDPWNDSFIGSTTYPNLKPYPTGKTTNIVGVMNTRPAVYEWQTTGYTPPPKDKLVIYELLVRDFLSQSNYQTLLDTLDYLENLGVNAIELMPVKEFEGNISWGYNPMFFLALDKAYGTPHAFKRFVDEAHSRGIAIILDQVLNHAFGLNPLVRLWWDGANNRPAADSPYFNPIAKHDFNVGYDFNHESKATQHFVDRVNRYWIEEYKIDGYRFDLSKGFTQVNSLGNVGFWGQYDASRVRLLKRMADRIWDVKPSTYVILEHFADNNEERELGAYGMMLWNNVTHTYQEASMGWVNTSNISNAHHSNRGFGTPALISYMESHDEQWIMLKNRLFGNSSNVNHDVKNVSVALQRQKLTGAFFFPVPGPKMLWQFGELGYGGAPSECLNDSPDCANPIVAPQVGRTAPKPIRWEYRANAQRYNLYRTWAALIRLKTEYPAFSNPSTYTQSMGGAIKSYRMTHPDFDVTVIGNFGVTAADANITFTRTGTWFDYFTGSSRTVSNATESIRLEPAEFRIFTTSLLPTPPAGIVTDIEDDRAQTDTPTMTALLGNYPNPFNPSTVIGYQLSVAGETTIRVYDLLGREVAVLVNGFQTPGRYEVSFHAGHLSSGVYLIRMQAGTQSFTRKMMLVK